MITSRSSIRTATSQPTACPGSLECPPGQLCGHGPLGCFPRRDPTATGCRPGGSTLVPGLGGRERADVLVVLSCPGGRLGAGAAEGKRGRFRRRVPWCQGAHAVPARQCVCNAGVCPQARQPDPPVGRVLKFRHAVSASTVPSDTCATLVMGPAPVRQGLGQGLGRCSRTGRGRLRAEHPARIRGACLRHGRIRHEAQ